MRTLTYTVVGNNGFVKSGITSFDEARTLTEKVNGSMNAVMVDVIAPYIYKGKRTRPVAKAPQA